MNGCRCVTDGNGEGVRLLFEIPTFAQASFCCITCRLYLLGSSHTHTSYGAVMPSSNYDHISRSPFVMLLYRSWSEARVAAIGLGCEILYALRGRRCLIRAGRY